MKTEAAILWRPGDAIEICEIDLAPPREGEVLVKIAAWSR
jgi:Zn-dependent alcohol dehydrogenase